MYLVTYLVEGQICQAQEYTCFFIIKDCVVSFLGLQHNHHYPLLCSCYSQAVYKYLIAEL